MDNRHDKLLLNFTVYRGNQLRQTLPSEIQVLSLQQLFKVKIKTWDYDRCQYQICSRYLEPFYQY